MPSITVHPGPPAAKHPLSTLDLAQKQEQEQQKQQQQQNPLPRLLQTPSGLAILEVQGTFNLPQTITTIITTTTEEEEKEEEHDSTDPAAAAAAVTTIGRIVFPSQHDASNGGEKDDDADADADDKGWIKKQRVYLYIGKHQRMTGQVKELAKPFAVLRRRRREQGQRPGDVDGGVGEGRSDPDADAEGDGDGDGGEDDLEIAEIIRYKILFASRPEPVGVVADAEEVFV